VHNLNSIDIVPNLGTFHFNPVQVVDGRTLSLVLLSFFSVQDQLIKNGTHIVVPHQRF
jgi:hypothetical protein